MKYYKVKNDIICTDNEGKCTTSDEPLWLRNEIDTWETGGRFFATHDAMYSYIISPKDIMDLSQNDLEELTEEEVLEIIAIAFPPNFIKREGYPDEIIPTPSLEKVASVKWGYAQNHTGNITSNETWTLANSPHNLTGNISVGANVVLTIEAGCSVYHDGNYAFSMIAGTSGVTEIKLLGTVALRIINEANQSRTGTGISGMFSPYAGLVNNSKLTIQYADIGNATNCFAYNNPTNASFVLDHLLIRDSTALVILGSSYNGAFSISNSKIIRTQLLYSANVAAGTGTIGLTNCEINSILAQNNGSVMPTTITVTYTNCIIQASTFFMFNGTTEYIGTLNFVGCVINNINVTTSKSTALGITTFTGCIMSNNRLFASATTTSNGQINFTNCDMGNPNDSTQYFITNGVTTGAFTSTMNGCFLSGHRTADRNQPYTGTETPAQVSGTITFTSPKTVRNFSATPTSITATAVTTTITVAWTTSFITRNRILVGTSTGVYTSCKDMGGSWSNHDGRGIFTTTPSIDFTGVSGTTYYMLPQSWDWLHMEWVSGTEQTATATSTPVVVPTIAGVTYFEPEENGALIAYWNASTGGDAVVTYNIYARVGSAPTAIDTYLIAKVDGSMRKHKFRYLTNATPYADTDKIYCLVKAENSAGLDVNTVSEWAYPTGATGGVKTMSGVVVPLLGR